MSKSESTDTRRRFIAQCLQAGGGALLLSACTSETDKVAGEKPKQPTVMAPSKAAPKVSLPDGLQPENFIMYSPSPLTLETKREKMGMGVLTPTSLLFVRNNLPLPPASIVANPDLWRLAVSGLSKAASLSIANLKSMGVESLVTVLQCSGNGRGFFPHKPSGSPWKTGAAGCVMWTGAPVSKVIKHLGGVLPGMKYLTATGGEVLPEGVDAKKATVERSIPLAKALDDCLLAWEINGQPIPISHGGPLRLVVPGYYGCNQIKYVKSLAFTEQQSQVKMQRSSYRVRPIGEKGNDAQPSMWRMNVKSWLNGPGADGQPVPSGDVTFYGVAFSGERRVAKVEYSVDNGTTWKPVTFFGPELGVHAWRSFQFTLSLKPGSYQIATRATDEKGDIQPAERVENHRGYANNSWQDLALTVSIADAKDIPVAKPQKEPTSVVPPQPKTPQKTIRNKAGKELFAKTNCGSCHALADANVQGKIGPSLDVLKPSHERVADAVENGVGVMPAFGEIISKEEIAKIADYVVEAVK